MRCPGCRRYFCRECATEHDERLLCAECLKRLAAKGVRKGGRLAWVKGALAGALGLLLAWLFFYGIGQLLVQITAAQDEGSGWQRR
ncbi:MAG: rhomboid family protein [Bryobacteraceae bacterium]